MVDMSCFIRQFSATYPTEKSLFPNQFQPEFRDGVGFSMNGAAPRASHLEELSIEIPSILFSILVSITKSAIA